MPCTSHSLIHTRISAAARSGARNGGRVSHMQPQQQRSAAATAATAHLGGPPPAAYVYSGPGAGTRSVLSTLHSLREALVPAVKVATLDTAELLAGGWQPGCLLLVMPGGADLPYCKHLNGRGNRLIRDFVEEGGAYLGLCAGAYYACARVEFEPRSRLEVVGDRELAFFPGAASGSIYSGFCYESEDGAVAAPLRFRWLVGDQERQGKERQEEEEQQQQRQDGQAAAAAVDARNDGGNSGGGTDNESDGNGEWSQWEECVDYMNGGPGFRLLDGSALTPLLLQRAQHQQAQQQSALQSALQSAQQQSAMQSAQQQPSQASQPAQPAQQLEGVELLAVFPEHDDAAAALLCRVGSCGGRAVLCGSHPELHPSWLAGKAPPPVANGGIGISRSSDGGTSGSTNSSSSGSGAEGRSLCRDGSIGGSSRLVELPAVLAAAEAATSAAPFVDTVANRAAAATTLAADVSSEGHVRRLQAALAEGQPQRWRLWQSLLVAAGLRPWMQQAARQ